MTLNKPTVRFFNQTGIPEDRVELYFLGTSNLFKPAFRVTKYHIDEWPEEYAEFKRRQSWCIKANILAIRVKRSLRKWLPRPVPKVLLLEMRSIDNNASIYINPVSDDQSSIRNDIEAAIKSSEER